MRTGRSPCWPVIPPSIGTGSRWMGFSASSTASPTTGRRSARAGSMWRGSPVPALTRRCTSSVGVRNLRGDGGLPPARAPRGGGRGQGILGGGKVMGGPAWLRPLFSLGVLMPLTVAVVSGCAAPPSGAIGSPGTSGMAAPAATSTETPWMDRTLTLPSGATLKIPVEWTTTAATDGVILSDPEKLVRIDLVEVDAIGGMSSAIAMAWSRRYPSFNRQELAPSDSPGREGWELFRWSSYKTSPEESRRVSAFGARKGPLAAVVLLAGPLATVQRRASQVAIVHKDPE